MRNLYKTNLIQIEYQNTKDEIRKASFAVGLLFYSVETGSFYVLGKNLTKNRIESRRLDRLISVNTLPETNKEYAHKKYFKIYSEMFSAAYDNTAYHVKVLFQNYGNTYKRFTNLGNIREFASIRPIIHRPEDCPYDYVYEDTLRGLNDFARYLRSFGRAVLAIEPAELTEKMKFTYARVISKYEELYE
jgi:predicted DNA-binding transcriptional regulator YafY